ncbi:hypothetical protein DRQ25_07140, partial [Candidatus Fermentibacteria bacterium]
MTIFYVATNGNDGKNGESLGAAWKTLNYALGQLTKGDTLKIRGGEYYGGGSEANPKEVEAKLTGTASQPIVVEAYQSEEVIITGRAWGITHQTGNINAGLPQSKMSKENFNPKSWMFGAQACSRALVNFTEGTRYFTLRNVEIKDSVGRGFNVLGDRPNFGDREVSDIPVSEYTSRYITFENVKINNSRLHSILVQFVGDFRWIGGECNRGACYYPHNGWDRKENIPAGGDYSKNVQNHNASITFNGSNVVLVEGVSVGTSYGEGIIFSSNQNGSNAVTVRGCTLYDAMRGALYMHACTYSVAYGNFIYNSIENKNGPSTERFVMNGATIQPAEPGKGWDIVSRNNKAINNIMVGLSKGLRFTGSDRAFQLDGAVASGNTIINCSDACITTVTFHVKNVEITNNLCYQSPESPGMLVDKVNGNEWDAAEGIEIHHNGWNRTPEDWLAVSDVVGNLDISNPNIQIHAGTTLIENFRLLETSDAIGAGQTNVDMPDDFEGSARNSPPDLGALEHGGVGSPTPSVEAVIGQDLTSGDALLTINFDGSGSLVQNDTIASYYWTFGDGTTGSGVSPVKIYDVVGIYDVSLKVTGSSGVAHTQTLTRHITVTAGGNPGDPDSGTSFELLNITEPAAIGQQVVTHSLGIKPSLALFFMSRSSSLNTSQDGTVVSAGMSDGLNHIASAGAGLNDANPSDSGSMINNSYAVITTNKNGAINASATVTFTSVDIVIDWGAVSGNQNILSVVLFSGTATEASVHLAQPEDSVPIDFTPDLLIPLLSAGTVVNQNISTIRQSYGFVDNTDQLSINLFERDNQSLSQVFQQASTQYGATYRGNSANLSLAINGSSVDIGSSESWPGPVAFAAIRFAGNDFSIGMVDTPGDLTPIDYPLGSQPGLALGITSNLDIVDENVVSGNVGHLGMFVFDGVAARHFTTSLRDAIIPTANQSQVADTFHIRERTGNSSSDVVVAAPSFTATGLRLSASGTPKTPRKMLLLQIGNPVPATDLPEPTIDVVPADGVIDEDVTVTSLNSSGYDFEVDFGDGSAAYTGQTSYTHQYTTPGSYTITATLRDGGSNRSTEYNMVVADIALVAAFTAIPDLGDAPLDVVLDGTGSIVGTAVISHTWKIVESSLIDPDEEEIPAGIPVVELAGVIVNNRFSKDVYSVQLTITDENDAARSSTLLKHEVVSAIAVPPVAGFTIVPDSGDAPLTVLLTPADTLHEKDLLVAQWIVDGKTFPGYLAEFTFPTAGTHEITRQIVTEDGSDEAIMSAVVTEQQAYPIGYSEPASVGKGTTNVKRKVADEHYHEHEHEVVGSEYGEPSKVVFTNAGGGTQLEHLGVGSPSPNALSDSRVIVSGRIRANSIASIAGDDEDLQLEAVHDVVTAPGSGAIVPTKPHSQTLGTPQLHYSQLFVDEIRATILVAREVLATLGGNIIIAETTKLAQSIPSDDFAPDPGAVIWMYIDPLLSVSIDDFLFMSGTYNNIPQEEWFQVVSQGTYQGRDYIEVRRDIEATGGKYWPEGTAVINTKHHGGGMIDLYASISMFNDAA